jgi:hypothetical protein
MTVRIILGRAGFDWKSKKSGFMLGLALLAIVFLTLITAPNNPQLHGSTYSRAPDGYGAWYEFMIQQGTPIQRWQRSFADLSQNISDSPSGTIDPSSSPQTPDPKNPAFLTLLRVHSTLTSDSLDSDEEEWLKLGNRLVVLGVYTPATKTVFRSQLQAPTGLVQIATRRRNTDLLDQETRILGDDQGAIVWRRPIGSGELIFVNTPHLAANAYQDAPGNYQFLASLVAEKNQQIWVDEYLHGYQDREVTQQEKRGSWMNYLAHTALLPVFVQGSICLLVLLWTSNQRFGLPISLPQQEENNSRTYINALGAVLRKAHSHDFVVELICKAEQLRLQRVLGLGDQLVDSQTLMTAWVNQTGRSAEILQPLCQFSGSDPASQRKRHLSEADLLSWLENINAIQASMIPKDAETTTTSAFPDFPKNTDAGSGDG